MIYVVKITTMELSERGAVVGVSRLPEALRALAQRWGSAVRVEAAETFELIREIR